MDDLTLKDIEEGMADAIEYIEFAVGLQGHLLINLERINHDRDGAGRC